MRILVFSRKPEIIATVSQIKPMRLLADGQIIRVSYEVKRSLGNGAFAEVYRVKHRFVRRQPMKIFKRVGVSLGAINKSSRPGANTANVNH